MFKLIMQGRGGRDLREMPPHIAEMDHLVCIAPKDIRIVLIKFYGTVGTREEKAKALGLDRRTFGRRVDRADYWVHSQLDQMGGIHREPSPRVYRHASLS